MRRLFLFVFILFFNISVKAVLNEHSLEQTLKVLRVELAMTHSKLKRNLQMMKARSEMQHQNMVATMQRSNQVALMLYSQRAAYTFSLTYACSEATQQYKEFSSHMLPYSKIMDRVDEELTRYEFLISALKKLPPAIKDSISQAQLLQQHFNEGLHEENDHEAMHHHSHGEKQNVDSLAQLELVAMDSLMMDTITQRLVQETSETLPFQLSEQGVIDRNECIKFSEAIMSHYKQVHDDLGRDNQYYEMIRAHLKSVYLYAQQRYGEIQTNIFVNGEDSYFATLKRLPFNLRQAKHDLEEKYENKNFEHNHVNSEWRGNIIWFVVVFVLVYTLMSFLLGQLIVRILMRKIPKFRQNKDLQLKTDCIAIATSFVLFSLAMMVIRYVSAHNFIIMASEQLVNFSWLLAIILISLIVRLKGSQIMPSLKIFLPIMVLGFMVVLFRILLIPNSVINLFFPLILTLFAVWEYTSLKRFGLRTAISERIYGWVAFVLTMVSTLVAWYGYVLLSVQIILWWLIQLMLILTITCIYGLIRQYENYNNKKLHLKNIPQNWFRRYGDNIAKTWFFDFIAMVLLPVSGILSLLCSIYMATQIFDLGEICYNLFFSPFLDIENVCRISLFKLTLVASLFFIFNYVCYAVKSVYKHIRTQQLSRKNKGVKVLANQANFTLFYNITAFVVWGSFAIVSLIIFQVPKSGIEIVSAGLATGVGFALKDLINNFFYGISLMTGRIRVGDWIECDGIRGKVDSITYQSTQIVTEDGSTIAFLNSTLFSENFKNLTKNHLYVKSRIEVGVSYGTDVNKVRSCLTEAISKLARKNKSGRDIMSMKRGISVAFSDFGDSSVNLLVVYWVLVEEKSAFDPVVKETIYNTLNENHVEIPFPQRDIHIIQQSKPAAIPSKQNTKRRKKGKKSTTEEIDFAED